MKKMLSVLLSVVILLGITAPALAGKTATMDPGLQILAMMSDGKDNVVFSPVSLYFALAMLRDGAEGETREEINNIVDIDDADSIIDIQNKLKANGLKIANAAFVKKDTKLRDGYQQVLRNVYDGELFELKSAEAINKWVAEKTGGIIDRVLEQIDPQILLVLANVVAMDMKWQYPFNSAVTYKEVFHAPMGDVQIDFMHQTYENTSIRYKKTRGVQMLKLPYKDSNMYMLLALPAEGQSVQDLAKEISNEGLAYFDYMSIPDGNVNLSLPKFDITDTRVLNDYLDRLGVKKVFTELAQLGNISEDDVMLSSVLQKARIQVDEDGTKAAAVTVIMAAGAMLPYVEEIDMTMDRPFIAMVMDGDTNTVCFAAIVNDPTNK